MATAPVILSFLLIAILVGSVGGACFNWLWRWRVPKTTITYSVENTIDSITYSTKRVTGLPGQNFLHFMQLAASCNPVFKFTGVKDPAHGVYITELNGLKANVTAETFWAFMTRKPDLTLCLQNVGVSTYEPSEDEHIVMSYAKYDIFGKVKNCATGTVETHGK